MSENTLAQEIANTLSANEVIGWGQENDRAGALAAICIAAAEKERAGRDAKVRPAVAVFAQRMEERRAANDHKGGWERCPDNYLLSKLAEEHGELRHAVTNESAERTADEAADIANIAMMVAGNALRRDARATAVVQRAEDLGLLGEKTT